MVASTTKKVVARRFERAPLPGYVNPASYLQSNGIEILTLDGASALLTYGEVKSVCFVRDFEAAGEPERKVFTARPKLGGLWVRMKFRDGDEIHGILPNNLVQMDLYGFTVTPPDPYSNNQKLFVPRAALYEMEVLGVVGSPLKRGKKKAPAEEQGTLFE